MHPAMIDFGQPQLQGLVELPQAVAFEAGQELAAHGPEEALDFAAALVIYNAFLRANYFFISTDRRFNGGDLQKGCWPGRGFSSR